MPCLQQTNWTEPNWPAPSWPSYTTRYWSRSWLAAVREPSTSRPSFAAATQYEIQSRRWPMNGRITGSTCCRSVRLSSCAVVQVARHARKRRSYSSDYCLINDFLQLQVPLPVQRNGRRNGSLMKHKYRLGTERQMWHQMFTHISIWWALSSWPRFSTLTTVRVL